MRSSCNQRSVAGSRSGGIAETQEIIDFCAKHGIGAEIEVIDANRIDEAYERLLAGDVQNRFVIDVATIQTDRVLFTDRIEFLYGLDRIR
jgi:uncharacterized zinc-type alcohol dehydrogenase-like protein